MDRRSDDRGPLRAGIFFPDASGGSGDSPARDGHLGGLRDGADRTRVCGACTGAKRRVYSTGRAFSAGRGAIGKDVERSELLATIADEETSRQLKQARTDLQAAVDRAAAPLPSSELLRAAEDNLQRLEKVVSSGNVPAVEYQKAKSEVNRLRGAVETERIERDRNLKSLEETAKKLEAEMKNAEVRSPIDGILTNVQTIDGELVSDGNELFTVSSRKTYVRGEVNEEDVGEVKPGMKAKVQLYAYRTRTFTGRVTSIQPAADPTTQRYTVVLEMENPPDNMMVGMTGEMNIITGVHENALVRADARAACRSSAGGKWGNCAATNRQRRISHTRFFGGAQWSGRRRSCNRFRSGQVSFRPAGAPADDQRAVSTESAVTPPLYIALRFLTHRKRALLLSLSGVVFGVAIFICTQAQTQGFSRYFIESNIGSNGALVVRSRFRPRYEPLMVAAKNSKPSTGRRLYFEGITNPNEIMRVSRQFPDVVSCSPVLRGTVSARAGFENATVDLYGIDPALHARTTDILHQLIDGRFDDFRNNTSAIIIGSRLAELLQTSVGDTVQLLAPNGEYWRFNVAAIARAGIGSIDSTRIYSHAKVRTGVAATAFRSVHDHL